MHRKYLGMSFALVWMIVFLAIAAGCGKQDIGGTEGGGVGGIYSIQEPYPAKIKVVAARYVILYMELPHDARDIEVGIGGDSYHGQLAYATFTDGEGIRRMRTFWKNIKISTEQGAYEVSLKTIREVHACAGPCVVK